MTDGYPRGAVVKGPDLLADHDYRPYVCLNDDTHPFSNEEGLYAAGTTTPRAVAIPLGEDDFAASGLPRETYVNLFQPRRSRHRRKLASSVRFRMEPPYLNTTGSVWPMGFQQSHL